MDGTHTLGCVAGLSSFGTSDLGVGAEAACLYWSNLVDWDREGKVKPGGLGSRRKGQTWWAGIAKERSNLVDWDREGKVKPDGLGSRKKKEWRRDSARARDADAGFTPMPSPALTSGLASGCILNYYGPGRLLNLSASFGLLSLHDRECAVSGPSHSRHGTHKGRCQKALIGTVSILRHSPARYL